MSVRQRRMPLQKPTVGRFSLVKLDGALAGWDEACVSIRAAGGGRRQNSWHIAVMSS